MVGEGGVRGSGYRGSDGGVGRGGGGSDVIKFRELRGWMWEGW